MHQTIRFRLAVWKIALLCLAALLPAAVLYAPASRAAGSTLVRVFIMGKTSYYDTSKDTVTLTAKSAGLQIGFQTGSVYQAVYSVNAGDSVRSSLDDIYIVVKETSSYADAATVAGTLSNSGYTGTITLENRQGKPVFQVNQGYYETLAAAKAAFTQIAALGYQPKLAGYYRLNCGTFTNSSDASAKAAAIRNAGFDAYLVGKAGTSGISYEVWAGDAATAGDRDQLAAALSAKGIASGPVSFSDDYVILKSDAAGLAADGTVQTRLHTYSESTGQELKFVPQGTPGIIRVEEKGITYRGSLIVRGYSSRLAIINELPVDDYVRGVVPKEAATGWPLEALKAQAVAARTFVMGKPPGSWGGVAAVDDTTYSQAYGGYTWEYDDTNAAVDQTSGQVLMYHNPSAGDSSGDVLVNTLFSSTHGGRSADPSEVWGGTVPYLTSVDSPYDAVTLDIFHEPLWYRVMFPSGLVGYVRQDFLQMTGNVNAAGLKQAVVLQEGVNVRAIPDVVNGRIISTTHQGDRVVIIDSSREWDIFSWMKGPYTPLDMQSLLNLPNPVTSLYVSKVGPSGRPMQITANGAVLPVSVPDDYRTMFGTISNLFTIEQTGAYTVQGAASSSSYPAARLAGQTLYVVGATGAAAQVNNGNASFVVAGAAGNVRVATADPTFIIHGNGFGHGLGMSQWGAYGMAQAGYNYQDILRHYYTSNVYLKTIN